MTIETARRASLEFVCVFGQDGSRIVAGATRGTACWHVLVQVGLGLLGVLTCLGFGLNQGPAMLERVRAPSLVSHLGSPSPRTPYAAS